MTNDEYWIEFTKCVTIEHDFLCKTNLTDEIGNSKQAMLSKIFNADEVHIQFEY